MEESIEERRRRLNRESTQRYRDQNREEINRRARERYAANPQKELDRYREYRERNKDKIRAYSKKYYAEHKPEFLEWQREWRESNPEYRAEYMRSYKVRLRTFLNEYKVAVGCCVCGYNEHPHALDFHHVIPSKKKFIIGQSTSIQAAIKEMLKCVVMCANCHRIERKHY